MLSAWAPSGVIAPAAFAASCDNRKSFSIRAAAKPGLYSLFAGDVGTGPGTGQYVVSDQHWPDEVEATSNSAWCESPSFSASVNASHTAIMEMPRIMLLQIFAACPAPASPQCTTFLPIASRIGFAAAKASAAPPAMKVNGAALAPPVPPDTGASSERR